MSNSTIGLAWLALTAIGLAGAAYLFRFEPMQAGGSAFMWDRWHQRACLIVSPMTPIVCSNEDVERLSRDVLPSVDELLGSPPKQQ